MKKCLAILLLALAATSAQAQLELKDVNFQVVGHPKWGVNGPQSQYGIFTIWARGCYNTQCFPANPNPRGIYELITDGTELWHPLTVYFQNANCDTSANFWFTVSGTPDPDDDLNANGRTAVTGNREYGLTTAAPGTPPAYNSYKSALGACVNQTGTAPSPASQYRLNGVATGTVWVPPFYFE